MNRTKRLSALGVAVLLAGGLTVVPATIASAAVGGLGATLATGQNGQVCPEEGKVETPDGPLEVTVTAPEGELISGYCVKAGEGIEEVTLDDPVAKYTIVPTSGKEISHYTLFFVPAPSPTPTPTDSTPTPTPTEPTETPKVVDGDRDMLARTGVGPEVGYALIALALAGGGIAVLALRRHRA
ncbi:hypothetical protein [Myceligenerans xiligouense]|uniref:Uncharacterized protein n=1 Tax=Myceligenerans xiligouense TaxID=253184 RepID=A0A3N4YGV4_9MICO|nr:hypothetical protein [Myceligenerans xiligouense]RPF20043.1 hypothetical protein EDD34_0619 [Myceligenerans xiligouense]